MVKFASQLTALHETRKSPNETVQRKRFRSTGGCAKEQSNKRLERQLMYRPSMEPSTHHEQRSRPIHLCYIKMLKTHLSCLSVCHYGFAIHYVSAPPCRMGRGWATQQNTGSHAAPSHGRRVLSIADNPQVVSSHRATTLLLALHIIFPMKNHATHRPIPRHRPLTLSRQQSSATEPAITMS